MRDVASQAGVSVATVSRVLNDSGPVRAETRRRVEEVARKLRYAPNGAARSLVTRQTRTIGVLLPALYGEFFSELMRGVDRTARRYGYHLLVSISHNHPDELSGALRAMRGRVDGLVLMSPGLDLGAALAQLPAAHPLVLLNSHCRLEDRPVDCVTVDNFGGARELARHLLAEGHRRIATITGVDTNRDAEERLRGYRTALLEAGIEPSPELEAPGDFTQSGGYRAALRLLELRPRPTAIFAANDSMAIGALRALREAKLAVPDDMALGGFDDIPMASYTSPALSTVHVPIHRLGARAVQRLLLALRQPESHQPRAETLPTVLMIRASSRTEAPKTPQPSKPNRTE